MSVSPDKKTAVLEQRVQLLQQELSDLKDREQLKNELNEKVINVLKDDWRISQEERQRLTAELKHLQSYKLSSEYKIKADKPMRKLIITKFVINERVNLCISLFIQLSH